MIGKVLAHYKIIEKLGAGGMGEVFRAEDTKLDRHVAIKVLPDVFAKDEERLARFEREAKVLASLNHPNIAAIHGLEEAEGKRFLVMELVEGDTLEQKLGKGGLPTEEALKLCFQVAEAIEAAHDKDIIHRDLKPANVKITPEGRIKVLDFGLAKALFEEEVGPDLSKSPTITAQMTRPGVILGTAAFMSPEQAKGKDVDKRTDIWAFGCLLYECLTGKQAFEGETVSETIASILKDEPNWEALPIETPPLIKQILKRCLVKDLNKRMRDIGDVKIIIEEAHLSPSQEEKAPTHKYRTNRLIYILAGAALIIGILIGFAVMQIIKPEIPVESTNKLSIELNRSLPFVGATPIGIGHRAFDISRDGSKIVYVAGEGKKTQLYLRSMESFESTLLQGTQGAYDPFFSYDGQWIGFFANNELKKVPISGERPITLCGVTLPAGACWSPDDRIVFSQNEGTGLFIISAAGGMAQPVGKRQPGISFEWPEFLPGENAVLVGGGFFANFIRVISLDTGEEEILIEGNNPKYLKTGHLLYILDGRIQAVLFDRKKRKLSGTPGIVIDEIRIEAWNVAQYAVSENGILVYAAGGPADVGKFVWLYRNGKIEELPFPAAVYGSFRISPDGKKIATPILRSGKWDIWIYDLERQLSTLFTHQGNNTDPIWTADGKSIAFSSQRGGARNVFLKPVDESGEIIQLTHTDGLTHPSSWNRDASLLSVMEVSADDWDIYLLSTAKNNEFIPFANSQFNEWGAEFSTNDRFIAYTSTEQAPYSVWIEPYPQTSKKWPISTAEGGEEPAWSPNSYELFYRIGQKWMVVPYKNGSEFTPGTPQVLFEGNYINVHGRSYDISPDGQRFLLIKPVEEASSTTHLNVVLNWFEELKQKVPK